MRPPHAAAGRALALAALAIAPSACAQVSGSVALATDYRLRGFSLTAGRPALSASAAYDHRSGLYAGGTVIGEDPEDRGARVLGHMEHAGYAWRGPEGFAFDVGVNNVDLRLARTRIVPIAYTEAYVGLARGPLSARAALAPDYPRRGMETLHLELNAAARPAEGWRVSAQAGASLRLGDAPGFDDRRTLYDVNVGVARTFPRGEVSLSVAAVLPRPYPRTDANRAGLTLAAALYF